MPLYSDSNYYYSGGSSQLYSPYYTPGSYGNPTQTTSVPYTSTYNRSFGSSYVVPPAPPRSPTYTSSHGLSSRYQPKLCTITETSALTGSSRHTSLMPLTRIHSPKFSGYTAPSSSISTVSSRYIPPRPIAINTADLDVSSSSRYRKHKDEEREREEAKELEAKKKKEQTEVTSPTSSTKKRRGSIDEEKPYDADQKNTANDDEGPERKTARSTIKRNRAVVRLSTIRSRSKDRSKFNALTGNEKSPEFNRNEYRDLPHAPPPPEEKVSWRQKLADDLASIPVYPVKKSPGDLIRERYLIQEADKKDKTTLSSRRAERLNASDNELKDVVVDRDPSDNSIRRLSIPVCPSFHDICEDISSDKIDDDLNAGELRRRASLIQEQEQDLLNQLQNSPSGTFQLIHLERQGSHDSLTDESSQRQSVNKRKSKKGKKIRHKITAIVDVENSPLTPIPQEKEEDRTLSPKPKFTVNVESVEEHHEIHKIFKLPKKKSIKKSVKPKDVPLPEGFVQAKPKAKSSPESKVPKKQTFVNTAEIFTFDKASVEENKSVESEIENKNIKEIKEESEIKDVVSVQNNISPQLEVHSQTNEIKKLKSSASLDQDSKITSKITSKILEKSQSLNFNMEEIKSPITLTKSKLAPTISKTIPEEVKSPPKIETITKTKDESKQTIPVLKTSISLDTPTLELKQKTKLLEKSQSVNIEDSNSLLTPTKTKILSSVKKIILEEEKPVTSVKKIILEEEKPVKLALKSDDVKTADVLVTKSKPLEKSQPINLEDAKPKVATPKPIRKFVEKSDSGEDFWTQIGSRETLYMTNRKKVLLESQWQKREDLLESQTNDEIKNLDDIKTAVTALKEEALQKANDNFKTGDKVVSHSHSNESSLCEKGPKKKQIDKAESKVEETKPQKKVASPKKVAVRKKTSELFVDLDAIISEVSSPMKPITRKKTAELLVDLASPKAEVGSPKQSLSPKKVTATKKTTELFVDLATSKADLDKPTTVAISSPKKVTSPKKTVELFTDLEKPKTEIDKPRTATPPITNQNKVTTRKKTAELLVELEKPNTEMDKSKTATIVAPTAISAKTVEPSTTTSKTTPEINSGQAAKSPEKQQNKFATATATKTTTALANNNKDKTPINNTTTTATTKTTTAATTKLSELATIPSTSAATIPIATSTTTTTTSTITAAKQQKPETKAKQSATTEADKKSIVDLKSTNDTPKTSDKTKLAATKTKILTTGNQTSKVSPTAAAKTKTSPTATVSNNVASTINTDQFISVAPAKTVASPIKKKNASPTKTTAAPVATATTVAATKTLTDKVVKASATSTPTTTTTIASTPTTATTTTTPKSPAPVATAAAASTVAIASPSSENNNNNNDDDNSDTRGVGNNLSKFATVSNLAQCLQDVNADLEDYIPSSAENSDNDDYTDISTDDISSPDGCEKLSASMKKKLKQRRKKEKLAERARFDPKKKITIDPTNKCYVKEEAPRFPLVATPRPLWKREKVVYQSAETDDSDSDESGSTEETEDSDECSTSEEYEDELNPSGTASPATNTTANSSSTASKENSSIIRMSTCSNDSGFEGGTAPSSPKKMLECDVNCHKKCERLTANMCGVNQKLIVEALAYVKRGARETRDSPSTPPSLNPAYKIEANEEHDDETSYTYAQFQKSGRFTAPATVIPRFKNYTVDDFHFLTVLGKGSFGKVLLAELRETTYYYAVKCLKKDVVLEDDDVDSTLIERKVLALGTKHPYLCHLFCTFQTESHLFFVMEYLNGGDLMFHIQESGRFSEERARFYGAEIISGLKFLHKKGIIYRDLKLDNVLLDYEGHVRIADFGMCKLQIYLDKTADSFCGTPDYMAPEIIKGEKYNQNVDWWSFGVLLYEMLIGQSPFSGCDEDELFWSICNEIPWFPVYISAEATGILKGLLEKDYNKRIGSQYSIAGDLSDHIFFRPIDWNLLEKRQLEPPYRPQVKHPLDTQYFDRVFTRERVRLTPIDKDILQSMDQKQFHGFTYTNPHITLD